MIKITGMIMVVASLTMIGFKLSMRLSCRFENLKYIKKMLLLLKGEIKYKNSMIEEAFAGMADNAFDKNPDNPYALFLQNLSESLKNRCDRSYKDIIANNIKKLQQEVYLRDADIVRFSDFLENLGYLDKEMQIANIDLYLEEIEISLSEALSDIKRNGRLYKLTGAAAGIFICLFIA